MIAPDKLRAISWGTFKATIYCAVAGMLLLAAVPGPGFKSSSSATAQVVAILAVASLGAALIANIVSLVTGMIAWSKGTRHCSWIIVSLLLVLALAGMGLIVVL